MPRIKVVNPGLLTSVQDAGRRGYEHLGVMVGGVMDDYAAAWANRLLGNPDNAAVLEVTLIGPALEAMDDGYVSLAGASLSAAVNGVPWPSGSNWRLVAGDRITFGSATRGIRAYIGFAGGLRIPPVLGSRSTDLVSGFGGGLGRKLQAGDVLEYEGGEAALVKAPVDTCLTRDVLRVMPGPRRDRFPADAFTRLLAGAYQVSPQSDRIGIRLSGPAVTDCPPTSDAISEGMAIGSIEVPPSGELLILMKSRGTIGGYSTLANVISADFPSLAQLRPGNTVSFVEVSEDEAVELIRARRESLNRSMEAWTATITGAGSSPPRQAVTLVAPSWCLVYRAHSPGGPPLIEPGQRVEPGQALAVIEVMKVFSPFTSPIAGTVRTVHFSDGAVVLEGEPLVEIEPE